MNQSLFFCIPYDGLVNLRYTPVACRSTFFICRPIESIKDANVWTCSRKHSDFAHFVHFDCAILYSQTPFFTGGNELRHTLIEWVHALYIFRRTLPMKWYSRKKQEREREGAKENRKQKIKNVVCIESDMAFHNNIVHIVRPIQHREMKREQKKKIIFVAHGIRKMILFSIMWEEVGQIAVNCYYTVYCTIFNEISK